MSRVGKEFVILPKGIQLERQGQKVICKGKKGSLEMKLHDSVKMIEQDGKVVFEPENNSKQVRAHWGMVRAMFANIVKGVSEGWTKELEIRGVGFKAALQGKTLKLNLGYSHDIDYPIPENIEIKCESPTSIIINGIDKQKTGQVAAEIRAMRPPEPYKGKGVRYKGEYVMQKEGKKK